MLRSVIIMIVLAGTSVNAAAQWMSRKQGGEFDDNPTHVAVTAKGKYGFGFRCTTNELKVILLTPESLDDTDVLKIMNATEPKLRVKVDGNGIETFDAELDEVDGKLVVLADTEVDLLKSVASAKSKVSAVLTVLGKNYHETTFNVRGSTDSLNKIIKGCKLDG